MPSPAASPAYTPAADRYDRHVSRPAGTPWFRHCGRWGLKLPSISLGCWHNFGGPGSAPGATDENCRKMLYTALDLGITHFDLANNYGPPPGSAEERVGKILKDMPRHELVISTKAGFLMWPGPYGEWGSRKYMLESLDQSLKRLGLDHVDIFYHHRPDPDTPLDETHSALEHAVRTGRAIYAGISNYKGEMVELAVAICRENRWPLPIIHQPYYNMFSRGIESDLLPVTQKLGMGVIAFCPLAQGLLTNRYLDGIPKDSRAGTPTGFLKAKNVTPEAIAKVRKLDAIAKRRGQSLAQMALVWVLRLPGVTTALIGASRPEQIRENVAALDHAAFSDAELRELDGILAA